MNIPLEEAVRKFCDDLVSHDPWTWRAQCAGILEDVDYSAPSNIEPNKIEAILKDGRKIIMSHDFDGWCVAWDRS